jgi:hypothetical protein
MARTFVRASVHNLEHLGAVATAAPLTFAVWAFCTDAANSQDVVSIGNSAGTDFFALNFGGSAGADPVRALTRQGGTTAIASTSTNYSANTWHHGCAVFAAANDRRAFIDGGSKVTETTSATPASLNITRIGQRGSNAASTNFSGRIAEAAIWNVALSDTEVAALARGIAPPTIQPAALIGYWPIWGLHSPEIDLTSNNRQMTVTGGALADHAPVQPFSARLWRASLPLLEISAGVPRQMMHYKRLRAA